MTIAAVRHEFATLLLQWHELENKRCMPWKEEKDPYKIWLSEIILQQTRVEQGMQYYLKFIGQFPTIQHLAEAPADEIFKLWEGLGYYSRCKNLIHTAKYISDELNGIFPDSYDEIIRLKGIGPYTAAAISSFAYNSDHAVVDGNVNRVLARYYGIRTAIDSNQGKVEMNSIANKILPKGMSALFNQAIMDFGATICKPKQPLCGSCTMHNTCKAFKHDIVDKLPIKAKSLIKKHRWFHYVVIRSKGKFLIRKRTDTDIWQSLHEFLLIETNRGVVTYDILQSQELRPFLIKKHKWLGTPETIVQQLTHQTIHATFYKVETSASHVPKGMLWVNRKELERLAFPRVINDFMKRAPVDNFL